MQPAQTACRSCAPADEDANVPFVCLTSHCSNGKGIHNKKALLSSCYVVPVDQHNCKNSAQGGNKLFVFSWQQCCILRTISVGITFPENSSLAYIVHGNLTSSTGSECTLIYSFSRKRTSGSYKRRAVLLW